ncbi:MAG: hypothetical protein ACREBS_07370, partial [Nitrososphaerales archaeon]
DTLCPVNESDDTYAPATMWSTPRTEFLDLGKSKVEPDDKTNFIFLYYHSFFRFVFLSIQTMNISEELKKKKDS